jgi:hypothetical protein
VQPVKLVEVVPVQLTACTPLLDSTARSDVAVKLEVAGTSIVDCGRLAPADPDAMVVAFGQRTPLAYSAGSTLHQAWLKPL